MAHGERRDTDKMTFLEHLEELRVRLLRSLIAVVVALGVCWNWSPEILHFMLQPLRAAFPTATFITTGPTEGFSLHMKAAFFAAVFLAAPFVLYQAWAFISPGLYAHEKRWVVPFVGLGSVFFVLGGAFGHWACFLPRSGSWGSTRPATSTTSRACRSTSRSTSGSSSAWAWCSSCRS